MTSGELRRRILPDLDLARYRGDQTIAIHLIIHFSIAVGLGLLAGAMADVWPLWALMLLALVAGHSVMVCAFAGHEIGHGAGSFRGRWLRRLLTWMGWAFSLFGNPTITRKGHNILHHHNTNAKIDPDRRFGLDELKKYGKTARVASWIFPNSRHPVTTAIFGFAFSIFSYHSSLLLHSLFCTGELYDVKLVAFERRRAALEFLANLGLYVSIWAASGFSLAVLLFLFVQYVSASTLAGAYIATNHLLCERKEKPSNVLENTVSLRVPRWVDFLHLNFSHHIEHHLFQAVPYHALPAVRRALKAHFPDQYIELTWGRALVLLLGLPMGFADDRTLVHFDGTGATEVPFPVKVAVGAEIEAAA